MSTVGVLAGRQDCVETLTTAVGRVAQGECIVVEVSGEPGAGKTRLLAEASALAAEAGLTVHEGRTTQLDRNVEFALYTDVLPTDPAIDGHGRATRIRVHAAVRRHLSGLAGPGVALVLDDLHCADQESLELTEFLIRDPPKAPVLLVVAFRCAQSPVRIVDAITRAGDRAARLRLGPLGPGDLETLFPEAGPDRRALLMRASRGNPLYLHALARLSDIELADLLRRYQDRGVVPVVEPTRHVLRALAVDLVGLDEQVRRVAHAVAVAGDDAATDLVAQVAELPVATVADALDQLCGAGLGDMDGAWFRFRDPLIRLAGHDMAGPAWRLRAHARAADYLRVHEAPLPVLAHHVERSAQYGDEQAAGTLLDAAESLVHRAPETAACWLGTALRILPPSNPLLARRPAVLLWYARALGLSGELGRSWEVLEDLLRDRRPFPAEAVTFGMVIARLRGDLDRASALQSGDEAGPGREPAVEGQLEVQRAALEALAERPAEVLEHALRALDLLDGRRPAQAAAAHALAAWAALCDGEPSGARTHVAESTSLLDSIGNATLAPHAELVGPLAWVETRLGDLSSAARHLARACEVVERSEHSTALPYLLIVDAALRVRLGRLDDALHLLDRAMLAADRLGSPEIHAMADAVRLRPLLWTSGPAAVFTVAERLAALERPRSQTWWRVARLNLGLACAAAENVRRCLDVLTDPGVDWPPDPPAEVTRHVTLAQGLASAGDLAAASRAVTTAEAIARAANLDYELALAWYAKAFVAARAGELEQAVALADASAARFAASRAEIEQARAHHLAGVIAAKAGQSERSREAFGRAKAGYTACRATWLLAAIARDQRRCAAQLPRRGRLAAAGFETLTSRERQIADLVATGLTNQQIATKLLLSRRTVESHLARIFPKLDIRSRAALAWRLGELG